MTNKACIPMSPRCALLPIAFVCCGLTHADTVILKSGVRINGDVTLQTDDVVRVRIGEREHEYAMTNVVRVDENDEKGKLSPDELRARAEAREAEMVRLTGLSAQERRMVKALMDQLQSTNEETHDRAKRELLQLHERTPLHKYFAWWLPSLSPRFVPAVLEILVEISPVKAVQVAADHVQDLHPRSRAMALTVLGTDPSPERIELLARGMADESYDVRIAAARALGDAKETAATPLLLDALRTGEPRLVSVAQRALQSIWRESHETGDLSSHDDWAAFWERQQPTVTRPFVLAALKPLVEPGAVYEDE